MKTESIKCDGCDAEVKPEAITIELKPLRGGLDLIVSRDFPGGSATGQGEEDSKPIRRGRIFKLNRWYHFCDAGCLAKFAERAIAEIEAPKAKGTQGTQGTQGTAAAPLANGAEK